MRAEHTRPGGRHIARERGSEAEPETLQVYLMPIPTNPLIERLNGESLAAMAIIAGITVSELERRYSA